MELSGVESWAEAQDAEASEGWREPVYHCALTQSRKEQSQQVPHGIERLAQSSLPLGVRESEASQTLTQTATASQLQGTVARPQEGALNYYRHHLFPTTYSMSLGKSHTL